MANEITLRLRLSPEDLKAIQRQVDSLDDKPLELKVNQNSATLKKGADDATGAYSQLSGVLSKVGIGLAGIGIASELAGNAFNAFKDKDTAIADLASITGFAGKELDALVATAERASNTFGTSVVSNIEAAKIVIGKLGPDVAADSAAFATLNDNVQIFAKASGTDSAVSAAILADSINALGYSAADAATKAELSSRLINVLAAASQAGAIEADAVSESLLKAGGSAKAAGLSIEETVGTIEIIGEVLANGSENGTAFVGVLSAMGKGRFLPQDTVKEMQALGINVEKVSDASIPWQERLNMLKPLLKDTALAAAFFGDSAKVAGLYAIENAEKIKSMTKSVSDTDTALRQAEIAQNTYQEKWNKITNWFTNIGVKAIEGFRDTIVDITEDAANLVNMVFDLTKGNWDDVQRRMTVGTSAYRKNQKLQAEILALKQQDTDATNKGTKAGESKVKGDEKQITTLAMLRRELEAAQNALENMDANDTRAVSKQNARIKTLQDRIAALTGQGKKAAAVVAGSMGAMEKLANDLREKLKKTPIESADYFNTTRQLETLEDDIKLITSGAAALWGNNLDKLKEYIREKSAQTVETVRLVPQDMKKFMQSREIINGPEINMNPATVELEKWRKQLDDTVQTSIDFGVRIGDGMAQAMADRLPFFKTVLKSFLNGFFDFLQRMALMKIAEATIQDLGTLGPIGLVKAALTAGLITAALEGVRGAVTGFATGGVIVGERGPEVIAPAKEFSQFAGEIVASAVRYMEAAMQQMVQARQQSVNVTTQLQAGELQVRIDGADLYGVLKLQEKREMNSVLGGR